MTNQEKKEWLMRYRPLVRQYKDLLVERGRWEDAATHITPIYSDMPKAFGGDKLQGAVDHMDAIDRQIVNSLAKIESQRSEIENVIEAVPDARLAELLRYRYIDGYTFEVISALMKYDFSWVTRLHGRALNLVTVPEHALENK